MTQGGKQLIVIDGNSLINRAYYAIQRPMITKEGIYTQGIYGFLTMLNKLIADYAPAYIVAAFDRKAPTFRHKAYDAYKAGRKPMPMELAMQLPLMKEVLEALRVKIMEIDGYEADDIIGTVVKRAEEAGLEPLIITGDRDGLQLASDRTRVLFTKRGISDFDLYDAKAMIEQYGFTPQQFVDYKALMGDASDNIPGLPGVGEKTASKLIREFGSVENLIEKSDTIANAKLREKVQSNAQLAMMSKRLATIFTEVPIGIDFDEMKRAEPDTERLIELYVRLEFNSFLRKLDLSGHTPAADARGTTGTYHDAENETLIARDAPAIRDAVRRIKESGAFAVLKVFGNNDHRDTPVLYGINLMSFGMHCYIPVGGDAVPAAVFAEALAAADIPLAGHHIQTDIYALRSVLRRAVPSDAARSDFSPRIVFDTALAQYLLEPTRSNYSIKTLSAEYFGVEVPDEADFIAAAGQIDLISDDTPRYAEYGRQFCRSVLSLKSAQEEKIAAAGLSRVYAEAELPLIVPLACMEAEGFAFDKNAIIAVGREIDDGILSLTAEIHALAGESFNINSPQQLGVILFEKMGLPSFKKTQKGYGTGAEVLEKLRDRSPIIEKILSYRTLVKLRGAYIDGLIPLVARDGKIHAHFRQTVTATGRISCTEPNLQNIPIRQEFGRQIRRAFVPESEEYLLVGADYSQIELRILAHYSEDGALVDDFCRGADIHRRTAARVFGVDESEVTPEQRSNAKAVNFGVIYGMSSFGLSEGLGITRKEAEAYIDGYFARHAAVKAYLDGCVRETKT
ncbi:MAG: DNA polymerase I, partial [Clostridiales Family XIII bacterium]|nr:DNA polymerase I [Clostridiales Family XIII bacterium]